MTERSKKSIVEAISHILIHNTDIVDQVESMWRKISFQIRWILTTKCKFE
jgi:hypothetical protein